MPPPIRLCFYDNLIYLNIEHFELPSGSIVSIFAFVIWFVCDSREQVVVLNFTHVCLYVQFITTTLLQFFFISPMYLTLLIGFMFMSSMFSHYS